MNIEPKKEILEKLIYKFNQEKFSLIIKEIKNLQNQYPKSVFLLNLLGAAYNETFNYDKAIDCFNQITNLNKNFSDAYYNLGIIYKKINNIEDSIKNYNKCININPKKFEAYNNLGNIYRDKNDLEKAIENYVKCLEIKSNYLIALQNFGVCLQNFFFTSKSKIIDKHIINLLEQDKILRPVDIIKSLVNYLHLDKKLKFYSKNIANLEKKHSLDDLIGDIMNMEILISLLKITPITDLNIEKILKYLRKNILINISSIKNRKSAYQLMNAIANQCFINEYLYPVSSEEEYALNKLEEIILINLKKRCIFKNSLEIACLAAYKPLNSYNWSNKIIDLNEISDLVSQQINEPNIEISLINTFSGKEIKNPISLKVKDQYENNPYPKWTKIALNSKPNTLLNTFNYLKLKIKDEEIKKWNNIDILVAGCGTGQHALSTATKFKDSFVTAIDLSAKSLSYAKRKADELEIKNINFIQMDILDLESLKKKFEIIESVGVLHHMEDPYKGFNNLCDVLKPSGLIMIGLYSKMARRHIERIRLKIKKLNLKTTEKNIKNYREKIINYNEDDYNFIKNSTDFYTLSNLRDLLFHVQEYRFSIPEIVNYLNKLNLNFCGFENRNVINLFKKTYLNEHDLYNLDKWNEFEINNPRIFAGMYQFWSQKN